MTEHVDATTESPCSHCGGVASRRTIPGPEGLGEAYLERVTSRVELTPEDEDLILGLLGKKRRIEQEFSDQVVD